MSIKQTAGEVAQFIKYAFGPPLLQAFNAILPVAQAWKAALIEDGELIINEEQAELVRRVFREYLDGGSYNAIAKGLAKDKIRTVTGNEKWWDSTISGMLENEKYYGDVLLQKTITVDFLNHKRKANKGQAQKYMVNDNHQPIIPKEIFEKVQDEKERRALLRGNLVGDRHKYSSKYPFSAKVF